MWEATALAQTGVKLMAARRFNCCEAGDAMLRKVAGLDFVPTSL